MMFSIFKQKKRRESWNKGKLIGQKRPLKPKEIWSIRIRLQMSRRKRELALFNLALDSKLRACDLTKIRVKDVYQGDRVVKRATILQQKTRQPVQFEVTTQSRTAIFEWLRVSKLTREDYLFPSLRSPHLSTRQYSRIVNGWIEEIGLDSRAYGTHSLRRTKASLIYHRTKNLRAVQLLLGHSKLENTVRYLGIDIDDALEMAEKTEV
jgi:integrase